MIERASWPSGLFIELKICSLFFIIDFYMLVIFYSDIVQQ